MKVQREQDFRILEFKENKFDIIGDVHGCYDELLELVDRLGYVKKRQAYFHPDGRRLISVGDVADKGPKNLESLDFWINQVQYGGGFWVHGNHCNKLYRYLLGNKVRLSHGLEKTVAELEQLSKEERTAFRNRYMRCYESQCYYLLLDQRRLAVVHGGLREDAVGRFSNRIRAVCLYGELAGAVHENGKPQRLDWASEYRGSTLIVYGHTVVEAPQLIHNTVDIDQGCVHGGYLTAMRYPEKQFIQVPGKPYVAYTGDGTVPISES